MDDEAAIRRVAVAFSTARDAHEADQTTVPGGGAPRASIEAGMVPLFATRFKVRHFTVSDAGTRFLRMDLAADMRRTMRGDTDPDGTKRRPGHGLANMIMREEGDGWAIPSIHNANVPAVAVDGQRHLGPPGCGRRRCKEVAMDAATPRGARSGTWQRRAGLALVAATVVALALTARTPAVRPLPIIGARVAQ